MTYSDATRIKDEELVRRWRRGESAAQIAAALGWRVQSVRNRVCELRKLGVVLADASKRRAALSVPDVAALNQVGPNPPTPEEIAAAAAKSRPPRAAVPLLGSD